MDQCPANQDDTVEMSPVPVTVLGGVFEPVPVPRHSVVGWPVLILPLVVEHGGAGGGGGSLLAGTVFTLDEELGIVPVPANTGVPATRRREERARTDVSDFIVIPSYVSAARSRVAG
jgi:hypothetical protein